jgi:hypothetical protein
MGGRQHHCAVPREIEGRRAHRFKLRAAANGGVPRAVRRERMRSEIAIGRGRRGGHTAGDRLQARHQLRARHGQRELAARHIHLAVLLRVGHAHHPALHLEMGGGGGRGQREDRAVHGRTGQRRGQHQLAARGLRLHIGGDPPRAQVQLPRLGIAYHQPRAARQVEPGAVGQGQPQRAALRDLHLIARLHRQAGRRGLLNPGPAHHARAVHLRHAGTGRNGIHGGPQPQRQHGRGGQAERAQPPAGATARGRGRSGGRGPSQLGGLVQAAVPRGLIPEATSRLR